MFRRNTPAYEDWEIYPSIDVEVGKRLLAENRDPYNRPQELVLEVDTEAAVEILKTVQQPDTKPTGINLKIVDNPLDGGLLKVIDPDSTADGNAKHNKDKTVDINISMDCVPRGADHFGHMHHYVGATVVHELVHAADFGSRSAMKVQNKFENKVLGGPLRRLKQRIKTELSMLTLGEDILYARTDPTGYGLTKSQAKMICFESPLERRAYDLEKEHRTLPRVLSVSGINSLNRTKYEHQ
jgi:hypothetical protein